MKSLYEIRGEYDEIMRQIEENSGEITPEIEKLLTSNQEDYKEKAARLIRFIQSIQTDISVAEKEIDIANDEIKRLTSYIKSKENTEKRIRSLLLDAVTAFGEDGKSGNKVLKTGTLQAYSVTRSSYNYDNVTDNTYMTKKVILTVPAGSKDVLADVQKFVDSNMSKKNVSLSTNYTLDKKFITDTHKSGTKVDGLSELKTVSVMFK